MLLAAKACWLPPRPPYPFVGIQELDRVNTFGGACVDRAAVAAEDLTVDDDPLPPHPATRAITAVATTIVRMTGP